LPCPTRWNANIQTLEKNGAGNGSFLQPAITPIEPLAKVLISLIGAILLSALGKTATPEVLVAIGSAAVGALAGLLAPSPVRG
jgi:hypothetical protein